MIREIENRDREFFVEVADEFYHSASVLHPIPKEHHLKTFDILMAGTSFAAGHILEHNGESVGYGLLAFTWSNEAGGMVVWVDELYVRPRFRGLGLGSSYLRYVEEQYGRTTVRFRLEIEPTNAQARKLYEKSGYEILSYQEMYRDL